MWRMRLNTSAAYNVLHKQTELKYIFVFFIVLTLIRNAEKNAVATSFSFVLFNSHLITLDKWKTDNIVPIVLLEKFT